MFEWTPNRRTLRSNFINGGWVGFVPFQVSQVSCFFGFSGFLFFGFSGFLFFRFLRFPVFSPYPGGQRAHTRAAQRRRPLRLNGYDDYDGNGDDRCGSTAGRPAGPHQDGQRAHTRTASGPIPGRPATAAMVTIAAATAATAAVWMVFRTGRRIIIFLTVAPLFF